MSVSLHDLSFDNISSWPKVAKIASAIIVSVLFFAGGYVFGLNHQMNLRSLASQEEKELKNEFEVKYHLASNLNEYKSQLREIKSQFSRMLKKLPGRSEIPALLEDISKSGVASGLEFKLFKPLPEKQLEFYTELPIQIRVTGDYLQLARFIGKISTLDRIVTLHDFEITPNRDNRSTQETGRALTMDLMAKTYWYQGVDEKHEN